MEQKGLNYFAIYVKLLAVLMLLLLVFYWAAGEQLENPRAAVKTAMVTALRES